MRPVPSTIQLWSYSIKSIHSCVAILLQYDLDQEYPNMELDCIGKDVSKQYMRS
jgi:hypothetical protein